MNNNGAIQPLILIVVEEYRRYCHRLNDVNGEETCVFHHKGQAVSLLVAMTRTRRRNVCFPYKGQAVSLHFIVTAINQMKVRGF